MSGVRSMPQLFIYETLRSHSLIKKLIGEVPAYEPATIRGYERVTYRIEGDDYETLEPSHRKVVPLVRGDVLNLTNAELKKLDHWESRYSRRQLPTSAGEAWVYLLKDYSEA